VRSTVRLKVVALDRAGKPLPIVCAGHIDLLADSENGDRNLVTRLQAGELGGRNRELLEDVPGLDTGLGQMTRQAAW
jgi:hypothetical protein